MVLSSVSDFFSNFIQRPGGGFAVIVALIFAIVQCFYGYRLFRYMVTFIGFGIFAALGYIIGVPVSGGQQAVTIAITVVFGLLGGFLAFRFYKIGVFFQCFLAGTIIGGLIGITMGWNGAQTISLAIIGGILLGLASVKLIKYIIVLSTGITGGMQTGATLVALVKIAPVFGIILGLVLSCCGIVYQLYDGRKGGKKAKDSEKNKHADAQDSPDVETPVVAGLTTEMAETTKPSEPTDITPASDIKKTD